MQQINRKKDTSEISSVCKFLYAYIYTYAYTSDIYVHIYAGMI
jgi:hypothetical protein